jgi:AcrR family transcriptional regulator
MSEHTDTTPPPSTRGGAPAQKRALRAQGKKTIRKLLDAGIKVLDARGYHATRVDDIVKMAKTSHGTFYLYFANKDDLLAALIQDVSEQIEELAQSLGPVSSGKAGYNELRTWLAGFSTLYEEYGAVIRAWTEAVEGMSSDFARLGQSSMTSLSAILASRIREASPPGSIDPETAALAFLAMVERFHYLVYARDLDIDHDVMLDTLTGIIHPGVFGGRRSAGRPSA